MGLTPVAIKDTGTALDIILGLFGLPAVCKNVSTGIALIKKQVNYINPVKYYKKAL